MMPEETFPNLVWHALHSVHAHFAIGNAEAARYPGDVVPYAALADANHGDLSPLGELLVPGEKVYLIGPQPAETDSLRVGPPLDCFQMVFPVAGSTESGAAEIGAAEFGPVAFEAGESGADSATILRMSREDAPDMVALTDVAFPGFFRRRTNEMGEYFGIRVGGELVAMAGERLAVPGWREISAVCTHPAHTGKGYATVLMNRLLREHAAAGLRSFLHVIEKNARAIALYKRMGFVTANSVPLWPIWLAD